MKPLRLLWIILPGLACSGQFSFPQEHPDCQQSPLNPNSLSGTSLSPKELSLTFDDGPGSRTSELSSYLRSQGIRATFFINGHCFDQYNPCGNTLSAQQILSQLKNDGHLIANHTQDHYDLTDTSRFPTTQEGDAAVLNELGQTDSLMGSFVDQNHFLFRPPFGSWDQRSYQVLVASSMNKYLGPVRWDIGGMMTDNFAADWDCWQNISGKGIQTTTQCGDRYLNEIHSVGRGISLMHDSDQINSQIGNTVDMVRYLIPILKAEGYRFVRADEVPDLQDHLDPPPPHQDPEPDQDNGIPPPEHIQDAEPDMTVNDASEEDHSSVCVDGSVAVSLDQIGINESYRPVGPIPSWNHNRLLPPFETGRACQ